MAEWLLDLGRVVTVGRLWRFQKGDLQIGPRFCHPRGSPKSMSTTPLSLRISLTTIALAISLPTLATGQSPLQEFIDAPPAPPAPATINRDAPGRATIRAVRIDCPINLDGKLDEEIYRVSMPVGGFIQQTPATGEPATEPTDVWIFFDDDNLYISTLCHETQPQRCIGTEMRCDAQGLTNDDNVMLSIDTFYDRRNAFNFQVNSVGGFCDQLVIDGSSNRSWNTIWDVKVADAVIAVDVGNNTYSFGRYFETSGKQSVLMSG
jgi:hypothetical protein